MTGFTWLLDRDDPDQVKAVLVELGRLHEEHSRRAEIHERAMTIRPRDDARP